MKYIMMLFWQTLPSIPGPRSNVDTSKCFTRVSLTMDEATLLEINLETLRCLTVISGRNPSKDITGWECSIGSICKSCNKTSSIFIAIIINSAKPALLQNHDHAQPHASILWQMRYKRQTYLTTHQLIKPNSRNDKTYTKSYRVMQIQSWNSSKYVKRTGWHNLTVVIRAKNVTDI